MNALALFLLAASSRNLPQILLSFLVLLLVLAVVGGLMWAIETWILKEALPKPVRVVIAIVLVILVVIWALTQFWPGAF